MADPTREQVWNALYDVAPHLNVNPFADAVMSLLAEAPQCPYVRGGTTKWCTLAAEAPQPRVLTELEEEIVRSAADWFETSEYLASNEGAHSRVAGLLMIIDDWCPTGAVRLDEVPRPVHGDTENPPAKDATP